MTDYPRYGSSADKIPDEPVNDSLDDYAERCAFRGILIGFVIGTLCWFLIGMVYLWARWG